MPNFHNSGIHFRILLIVNLLAVGIAVLLSPDLATFLPLLAEISMVLQPILLLCLLALYSLNPQLQKLDYRTGALAVLLVVLTVTYLVKRLLMAGLLLDNGVSLLRSSLYATVATAIVMYYFHMQQRAYSPAIAEARLQALQARIRPHFLFNSINAVLSLIRSQPKRAETALEDLADLFRVLMADNRDLVPISQEIALCRQYLALEQLRLEDRLKVTWQIDDNMPPDAMVPPLVMQPLIENAVYHGIEPAESGGEIVIEIYRKHKDLHMVIRNPYVTQSNHQTGNKMALKNIQERLRLHFDLEAAMTSKIKDQHYEVHIRIPLESES